MNTSIITIFHGDKEFIPLILDNFKNFNDNESLELIIIDDGKEDLMNEFKHIDRCTYIHLDDEDKNKFINKIEEEYKQKDKSLLLYEKKLKSLPKGFLRDYGCGMSSFDTIFHMNYDCIYNALAFYSLPNNQSKLFV